MGRSEIVIDDVEVVKTIISKTILVKGAGGSIGTKIIKKYK